MLKAYSLLRKARTRCTRSGQPARIARRIQAALTLGVLCPHKREPQGQSAVGFPDRPARIPLPEATFPVIATRHGSPRPRKIGPLALGHISPCWSSLGGRPLAPARCASRSVAGFSAVRFAPTSTAVLCEPVSGRHDDFRTGQASELHRPHLAILGVPKGVCGPILAGSRRSVPRIRLNTLATPGGQISSRGSLSLPRVIGCDVLD